ncbi:hypothetical protein MUU49_11760 [Scandinavium goeteborgense]|uniref:hypothetical protein n=1 Tax=Scandinavium goeteborgense TaxID=1851514 RepID=UPI002165034E|nr:hypothetical protein [Scandinavium goeteborgense]MCS2153240.1 hypothetical protein [Scandinavium goeteborgense]
MSWDIPQPFPVSSPPPPRWSLWWRWLSLCCFLLVLAGAALWFLLHDSRVLLWTLVSVTGCIALFALLGGWMLFRSGVDGEHAQGLMEYNRLQEYQWQRWAQQSVPVVAWYSLFPAGVLAAGNENEAVSADIPLMSPHYPGDSWLMEEIIMALLPELQSVIHQQPLEVCLPEGADHTQWRQFVACWQQAGLPVNRLTAPATSVSGYEVTLGHWLQEPVTDRARLVIVKHWTGVGEYTEGVVAWLLAPEGSQHGLPVRCSLHRPDAVAQGDEASGFTQFLHYQPLTTQMAGFWTDRASKAQADSLVIAHSQRLKKVADDKSDAGDPASAALPPSMPAQYWLPHWLGQSGPCADWFAVTLMMAMAEHCGGVQCALLSSDSTGPSLPTWILASVSAGAFVND